MTFDGVAKANGNGEHRVWVPDPREGFVFGIVIRKAPEDRLVVRLLDSDRELSVCSEDIQPVNPSKLEKVEDMSSLSFLNDASVLYNLRQRYYSSLIYTYSGLFCLAVNPYKQMPLLYSESVMATYRNRKRHEVPPHIFATTDNAFRQMLLDREDQSILCTGESGAGKTENTKKIIQYLTFVAVAGRHFRNNSAPNSEVQLEDQLLLANPILEAFGNSKTVKNDNSSRFGKFIRISFDQNGCISGGNIAHYLLEKSRTIRQAPNERSFHIFYQLLLGSTPEIKSRLFLENDLNNYGFLTNGKICITNVDDSNELSITLNAMKGMGFSVENINALLRLTSAILLLGNLTFVEDHASEQPILVDDTVAQKICCLFGLPLTELTKSFLKPRVKVGRDFVQKSQSRDQVQYAVEAIAKACYERMFRWLVMRINRSLIRTTKISSTFIGILDIAGFEIFDMNSFEQLCINYTNEKLQQLFNNTMFVLEQEEYRKEGIKWDFIDFGHDLQPTIDLIEKPMGILSLLDDECIFPKSTDKSFVEKLIANQTKHPKFIVPELKTRADFAVLHYAGRVDYSASQWLMKNMDPLNDSVVHLLQNSSDPLVAEIWKNAEFASLGATDQVNDWFGVRIKKGMFRTVGNTYKEQLCQLMLTLRRTNPHFLRCIVPNREKKAGLVDGILVLDQLRCNGVLEGIRICRQGYPNRIPFHEFRRRYEMLVEPGTVPQGFLDGKEASRRIVKSLEIEPNLYSIGHSKIFFRAGVIAALEECRDKELTRFLIKLQSACRGYFARSAFKKLLQQLSAIRVIQRNGRAWSRLKNWEWWRLFSRVKPLLEVTASEKVIAEKENELKSLRESIQKKDNDLTEFAKRLDQLTIDRSKLQKLLENESAEKSEIEELKDQLILSKSKMEEQVAKIKRKIQCNEAETKELIQKRESLENNVKDLERQLSNEKSVKEKLEMEMDIVQQRVKNYANEKEKQKSLNEKLKNEKAIAEKKLTESVQKIADIEDQNRQTTVAKLKLESHLADLEHSVASYKQAYETAESARKLLVVEVRECKEAHEESQKKLIEFNTLIERKDEEIHGMQKNLEEQQNENQRLCKECKDFDSQLLELKDELENEKTARIKSERGKRDYMEELEALKQELLESQDNTQLNVQLRTEREKQFVMLKKEVEDLTKNHEQRIADLKSKHGEQLKTVENEIEVLKNQKEEAKKNSNLLENQSQEKQKALEKFENALSESERKRKNAEKAVTEWQNINQESEKQLNEMNSQLKKARNDVEELTKNLEISENTNYKLQKRLNEMDCQMTELSGSLSTVQEKNENLKSKLSAQGEELQIMCEKNDQILIQLQKSDKELQNVRQQLIDEAKKYEEKTSEQIDEVRRKLRNELEICKREITQSDAARIRAEKAKRQLAQENEDALNELDKVKAHCRELEKKQRKFDQQLEEERNVASMANSEKDALAQEIRDRDSKALVLAKEVDGLNARIVELENIRSTLQLELDNALTLKDDSGRNALELDKIRRNLESDLEQAKETITELEDSLQLSEDSRLRLDVNLQSAKSELEKLKNERDRDDEEKRRAVQSKIRELEEELETERRGRISMTQQKRKLESEQKLVQEESSKLRIQKDELIRQNRKSTQLMKEYQSSHDEIKTTRDSALSRNNDLEKRIKEMESELAKMSEENIKLMADRRKAEREKDDLIDQLSIEKGMVNAEEKKRLERKVYELEEQLEEEQNTNEVNGDKLRKTQMQLETLTAELAAERSLCEKSENERKNHERQCKELKAMLDEMESDVKARNQIQLSTLEAKIQAITEQCEHEQHEKDNLVRQNRRTEKKLNDALVMIEDDKRNKEHLKESIDRALMKQRELRHQVEELEESVCRERAKSRQLQRNLDESNDLNETLTRENKQLKVTAVKARSTLFHRGSISRFTSDAESIDRGTRSLGGDSIDLNYFNSGSTVGSTAGEEGDVNES